MNQEDRLAIACLRGLALDLPRQADSGSGHSGTALALAPLGWLLYSRFLRFDPGQPDWPDRDRLVMSNGHACVLLYGLLHLCGFDLSLEDLRQFRRPGSRTPGHPESWVTPGVDFSTGPLGQGLAAAVGMAWAEQRLSEEFGRQLVDHYTYVLCSDGDLMEGVSAEASSLAGHLGLGQLIAFYDDNRVTIDGPCSQSFSEDVAGRYQAYGWQVLFAEGEDLHGLKAAVFAAQADPRPSLICVRTVIGYPAPTMQGRSEAHSPAFSEEEIRATKQLLGLNPDQLYQVPLDVRARFQQQGAELSESWRARLQASPLRARWEEFHSPPRPPAPPSFAGPVATRVASGQVLEQLQLAQLVGGSADLAGSTNTRLKGAIHFGVRESAMAAFCNGVAAHGGLIPFCSTYFAFSDQMKPSLRLAALARLGIICVWTHDSLALGEDGPTHQPVEQLASLRALPNFWVLRPADARETVQAWRLALGRRDGPSGLILSRQTLPLLPVEPEVERGAYVVRDGPAGSPTLLATGSEVHLCLEAAELMDTPVRVVSMPCWELFESQPPEYQALVLGEGPRLAVEAASPLGWHRWADEVLGLERFGASGPGPELMQLYGFSPAAVAERTRTLLLSQGCRRSNKA
ncbi:MAG: transketolase [Vulcanimicrobiota bacterium]